MRRFINGNVFISTNNKLLAPKAWNIFILEKKVSILKTYHFLVDSSRSYVMVQTILGFYLSLVK